MVKDVHLKVLLTIDGETTEFELGEGRPATAAPSGGSPARDTAIYPRPKAKGKELLYEQSALSGKFYFAIPYGADTDGVKFSEKVIQARSEWQEKDNDLWGTFNGDNEKDGKTYKGTGYWMLGRAPKYGALSAADVNVALETFKGFGFESKETKLLK